MSTSGKQWTVLVMFAVLIIAFGALLAFLYQAEVGVTCRANPCDAACAKFVEERCEAACHAEEPRTIPNDCSAEPSMVNARFFAAQTITTTGYGSDIFLGTPDVQDLAFWGMSIGSLLWAILTAALFSVLTTRRLVPRPR